MPKNKKISLEVEAKVLELRSQGKLYREIASELGVGKVTLERILNPEAHKRRILTRKRRRTFIVHTVIGGKRRRLEVVGRRPRPSECELCGRKTKRRGLDWHHWDDEHLEQGLWLCMACHRFAGSIENGRHERYLGLKSKAIRGEL